MKTGLKLNYVVPNGRCIQSNFNDMDAPWWDIWLDRMVKENPDTIFFYTVDSTDIWVEEWDFNEVRWLREVTPFEISLDKAPNAFGYGIDHATLYIESEGGSRPPTPDDEA